MSRSKRRASNPVNFSALEGDSGPITRNELIRHIVEAEPSEARQDFLRVALNDQPTPVLRAMAYSLPKKGAKRAGS